METILIPCPPLIFIHWRARSLFTYTTTLKHTHVLYTHTYVPPGWCTRTRAVYPPWRSPTAPHRSSKCPTRWWSDGTVCSQAASISQAATSGLQTVCIKCKGRFCVVARVASVRLGYIGLVWIRLIWVGFVWVACCSLFLLGIKLWFPFASRNKQTKRQTNTQNTNEMRVIFSTWKIK